MVIDRYMPRYDVSERHRVTVDAPAGRVYETILGMDLGQSWLIKGLVSIRELPGALARRGTDGGGRLGMTLDDLRKFGFVTLAEEPGRELVLGLVGRFWAASGGIVHVSPQEFGAFATPGYSMAAWNFTVKPLRSGKTRLETITRVRCTDARSRRLFRAYWTLVGPFSGLIRREALRLIRREAEGAQQR